MGNRSFKVAAVIFGALVMSACAIEPPKAPIIGNLTYKKGLNLIEQKVTRTRVGSIRGSRCYRDTNSTSRDHEFKFDDPGDQVKVVVTDTDGVRFGWSYSYRLFFKDSRGAIKGDGFPIVLDNTNGTGPRHDFEFVLSVGSTTPGLAIPPGTILGGVYELSESDRNLAVELYFDLEAKDVPVSSVCNDYD